MIGFDHNHEQLNKELKMHGGNLNLSDECAFTEWSVAGPEIAWVIAEFEAGMTSGKDPIPKHHDQSASVQNRFAADTKALVTAFQKMGNSFLMKIVMNSPSLLIPRRLCQRRLPEVSCVLMKKGKSLHERVPKVSSCLLPQAL